jgi:hypothetical protein
MVATARITALVAVLGSISFAQARPDAPVAPSPISIQRAGGALKRCYERIPDERKRAVCFCERLCRKIFPAQPDQVEIRYPMLGIDGLYFVVERSGDVSSCGYSRMGHPEVTVPRRTCSP